SSNLQKALTKHYGFKKVVGGKGNHIKLERLGFRPIILPGNRKVVSPGVVKQILDIFGGHSISKVPDLIKGKLKIC
ncbi:hypothetical protein N9370_04320, partial [Paracoccaceae bacterium]|nr:hypothetical protein [Paracoccaceae bacterium]